MKQPNAMQVDVFDLAEGGQVRAGEVRLDALPRLAQSQLPQAALATPLRPIAFRFEGFVDDLRRPSAHLSLNGEIDLGCDRCGKPLRWSLATQARYFFVRTETELGNLPVDEAEEEPLLGSTRFDLRELIEDEAILALPMSPRHDACEPDLALAPTAVAAAGASKDAPERPHPFAQLEKLKSRRN